MCNVWLRVREAGRDCALHERAMPACMKRDCASHACVMRACTMRNRGHACCIFARYGAYAACLISHV